MDRIEKYSNGLSNLIKCETISIYNQIDITKFERFHEILKKEFPNVFNKLEIKFFNGSLLLKLESKTKGCNPILFMNHSDVVDSNGIWDSDPFNPIIKDEKLYGRGTLDTKGGLYCMLEAMEELLIEGFEPFCDIYFESSIDEECSAKGALEIANYLKDNNIHFDSVFDEGGMIMYEPISGAKDYYAVIGVGEKACVDLKFIAKSNGGHASTPGKNTPLARLAKFIADIDNHNIFKASINQPIKEMFKSLSKSMHGLTKILLKHPTFFSPIIKKAMPNVSPTANALLRTTLAFTMASGSNGVNVLPSEAYIVGNMRCSHHEGIDASLKKIEKYAKKYDIEIVITDRGIESGLSKTNTFAFNLMKEAINNIFDGKVKTTPYVMTGASDARYFDKISDGCYRFIPFIITDKQMESIHGINENVDIKCLSEAVDYYKYLMKEYKNYGNR